MVNNNNKTLIEKLGFDDKELSTPEHDEMVLWCYNKSNMLKILEELKLIKKVHSINWYRCCKPEGYGMSCDWDWEKGECTRSCKKNITKDDLIGQQNEIRILKDEYKDMKNNWMLHLDQDYLKEHLNISWEYAILGYNHFNIGFLDLALGIPREINLFTSSRGNFEVKSFLETAPRTIYFEIKPTIRSIGEVIRQINMYKSHLEKPVIMVLVTKTKGLKELFLEQGIYVYEYGLEDVKQD